MKDQENIIARARRGDADAFEQLVVAYRDQVFRLALRMCGNEADADEVAQEAFLSAWKALPNFRGDSRFSTWLYQLTSHAAIDLMRREKRQIAAEDITEVSAPDPARPAAAGGAVGDPAGCPGRHGAAFAGVPADRSAAVFAGAEL